MKQAAVRLLCAPSRDRVQAAMCERTGRHQIDTFRTFRLGEGLVVGFMVSGLGRLFVRAIGSQVV
jgi:hypothetical protein